MLAQAGADMLVQGLRERLFVPPLHPMQHSRRQAERAALEPAPKITPEHRRVQLKAWSAAELVRRAQTIGPLWSHASPTIARQDGIKAAKRVIWSSGFELVDDGEASGTALGRGVDKRPGAVFRGRNGDGLYLVAADCRLVRARRAKVEGRADMDAVAVGNLIAGGKESKEGDEGQEGSGIELLDLVTG
jgi:methionyl-tRNA formyltransferase